MLKPKRILFLLTLIAFGLIPELSVYAQDAETAAPPPDDGQNLVDMWILGGWAMYPLTFLSVCAFALLIYNGIKIRGKEFLKEELNDQLKELLVAGQIEDGITFAAQNPSAITNIVGAGIKRVVSEQLDPDTMKEAMEEVAAQELAAPFVLINYINVIAVISPMIGLLGTVSGMIKAFNVIATQGTGDPKVLALNISEALITTASGMIVGIPAMVGYFFFKNKYGAIASRVSQLSGDTLFAFITSANAGYGAGGEEVYEEYAEEEYAEE